MGEKAGSSVGLWLCKGPVVREQLAQGGLGRSERAAAHFSKCRVEGEQREREALSCHTMKGLMATWKDWALL